MSTWQPVATPQNDSAERPGSTPDWTQNAFRVHLDVPSRRQQQWQRAGMPFGRQERLISKLLLGAGASRDYQYARKADVVTRGGTAVPVAIVGLVRARLQLPACSGISPCRLGHSHGQTQLFGAAASWYPNGKRQAVL